MLFVICTCSVTGFVFAFQGFGSFLCVSRLVSRPPGVHLVLLTNLFLVSGVSVALYWFYGLFSGVLGPFSSGNRFAFVLIGVSVFCFGFTTCIGFATACFPVFWDLFGKWFRVFRVLFWFPVFWDLFGRRFVFFVFCLFSACVHVFWGLSSSEETLASSEETSADVCPVPTYEVLSVLCQCEEGASGSVRPRRTVQRWRQTVQAVAAICVL